MSIIYLRNRKRQPVWRGVRPMLQDAMGEIPLGWCSRCAMECYGGGELCPECKAKEKQDEENYEISLQPL